MSLQVLSPQRSPDSMAACSTTNRATRGAAMGPVRKHVHPEPALTRAHVDGLNSPRTHGLSSSSHELQDGSPTE